MKWGNRKDSFGVLGGRTARRKDRDEDNNKNEKMISSIEKHFSLDFRGHPVYTTSKLPPMRKHYQLSKHNLQEAHPF